MSIDRYSNQKILKSENGNRIYSSTVYPKIEENNDDIIIVSGANDRLDLLANVYYGDVTLWWIIAQSNISKIKKGTMNLPPGIQLRIPRNLTKIFNDLEKINVKG